MFLNNISLLGIQVALLPCCTRTRGKLLAGDSAIVT